MGFRFALQHAEQHEIDKTAGERLADGDMQDVRDRERQAVEQRVHHVQRRRDKQEREFDRFGDAGQERGQRRRQQQPADALAVLRTRALVHRQQAPTRPNIMVIKRPDMKRAVPM